MTWNAFHRRGEILREVAHTADARLDGVTPMDVAGVSKRFTDEVDVVGALILTWHARLGANIDRALASEPMDRRSAVATAWRTTAEQMPGVRLVIDRATDEPSTTDLARAMQRARSAERARLAQAAGLANDAGSSAVVLGGRIEEQARTGLVAPVAPAAIPAAAPARQERAEARSAFVRRIKAVLAA